MRWRLVGWVVGSLGAVALATAGLVSVAPTAGAAPTTLFSETTPGFRGGRGDGAGGDLLRDDHRRRRPRRERRGRAGRAGAFAAARFAVTPGTTFRVAVGGGGTNGNSNGNGGAGGS